MSEARGYKSLCGASRERREARLDSHTRFSARGTSGTSDRAVSGVMVGGGMLVVECADLAQMRSYLYQADGVLIAALKACEGNTPDAVQNAVWAAAVLIEQALVVAERIEMHSDGLEDGAGI
jgi:hypothetical protein